ncbi:hypothetical protein J2Z83_002087 [Virgibacillus natechei]|uniref:Uncharacterized protein n=1 Tax=Virgibacillus natechei TaxID=1216297 RepID=A0ABS4IGB1_9BACI|nr:hypothetical protein [Virgibacillus natechei]MBP1969979.1 hypothetical protein [Virgibacillus natechei]UZD13363.1 intracellular growth attenuator family protein [Virgibacillus natechei]
MSQNRNITLVLQEEQTSIRKEVEINPELKKMIQESREEYRQGLGMSTSELLESLSSKDFEF